MPDIDQHDAGGDQSHGDHQVDGYGIAQHPTAGGHACDGHDEDEAVQGRCAVARHEVVPEHETKGCADEALVQHGQNHRTVDVLNHDTIPEPAFQKLEGNGAKHGVEDHLKGIETVDDGFGINGVGRPEDGGQEDNAVA